jgi:hypothetical protein
MLIHTDYIILFIGIAATVTLLARAFSKPKTNVFSGQKTKRSQKVTTLKSAPAYPEQQVAAQKLGASSVGDSANQLRIVSAAQFSVRPIMSPTEARVFRAAENALVSLGTKWRVMAQVSLGEIVSSRDWKAYASINSKRVDLLIISEDSLPIAAIEFQGSGHYLSDAAARDAVKKEALRRAGIGYIEIVAGDDPAEVRNQISRFIKIANLKAAC